MKELINWYYNLNLTYLESFHYIYYAKQQHQYLYIIPVGKEKNTVFFHLLQLLQFSPKQKLLLSKDNTTTVLYEGTHYYVLLSEEALHTLIDCKDLKTPIIYPDPYQVAEQVKDRWISKNRHYEEQLNGLLERVPMDERPLFLDIATYYIHLNEQAYTLINKITHVNFDISLVHKRLCMTTYKFECYYPALLTLDNKSRIYCEYIRHTYLTTRDLNQLKQTIQTIQQTNPLNSQEWEFLYARLFFPTHFYDQLYNLKETDQVNVLQLYDEANEYARLLYYTGRYIQTMAAIELHIPSWVKEETMAFESSN